MNKNLNTPISFEFSKVDLPLPIQKVDSKGVIRYGINNLYPQYLNSLYSEKSPTLQALLSTLSDFISGSGFEGNTTFIENGFSDETLNDILPKISLDLSIYGSFSLNVIWSKDKKSISRIEYIDVSRIRLLKETEGVNYCLYCDNWADAKCEKIQYPLFDGEYTDEPSQILYAGKYSPGMSYYYQPSWTAGVPVAEMEYQLINFHLADLTNGFTPSLHINLPYGIPQAEQQGEIYKSLKKQYEGTDKASKLYLTFSEIDSEPALVNPIQLNNANERYIELNKLTVEKLLVTLKATSPELFGIQTANKLASTDLIEAFQVYQVKVVDSFQQVIEKALNKITKINGVEPVKIVEYDINKILKPASAPSNTQE